MNFKWFNSWLREIFFWAAEARLAFLFFLVVIVAFLFGFYICPTEPSIRTSGYVLQILGMLFAIRGLLKIRAHFRQSTLRSLAIEWLYRFPKWKKDTVINVGGNILTIAGMKARLEIWTPDNPKDPLEKRIDGIAKNIGRIMEEQRRHSEQIDELYERHKKHRKEQEQARVNIENQFRTDLESLHTSGIVISLIGLIWLTLGISMSTMSQELFKIIQ